MDRRGVVEKQRRRRSGQMMSEAAEDPVFSATIEAKCVKKKNHEGEKRNSWKVPLKDMNFFPSGYFFFFFALKPFQYRPEHFSSVERQRGCKEGGESGGFALLLLPP